MAPKNKVSVSSEPNTYRLSANERRAARLAEISNKQGDLKREAAERRARRAVEAEAALSAPKSAAGTPQAADPLPAVAAEPGHPA
jgi:hypothetical protein